MKVKKLCDRFVERLEKVAGQKKTDVIAPLAEETR